MTQAPTAWWYQTGPAATATSSTELPYMLNRAHKLIYVSCGAGRIDVIQQVDPNHYRTVSAITTAPGARTSLFVPELGCLYVAVPHRESQQAQIMVFATQHSVKE